jgi:hypothetical protein
VYPEVYCQRGCGTSGVQQYRGTQLLPGVWLTDCVTCQCCRDGVRVCRAGLCRYAQSYWEESTGGSEVLSRARLQAAFTDLIRK